MLRKLTIALLAATAVLAMADAAGASQRQIQIIQADPPMLSDPVGNPGPVPGARRQHRADHRPLGFHRVDLKPANGSDPNSYPAANWAPYDAIVRDARTDGIRVDFTVAGGAPRWAEGAHVPPQGLADKSFAWKPNATFYGQFVHAVGERYDGSFTPAGDSSPLPAVRFWAIWNEPNFGQDLGPQAINGSTCRSRR